MQEENRNRRARALGAIGAVGALIPLFSLALSAYQFVKIEDQKLRQQSFENYHALIARFTNKEAPSSAVVAATIFELKNYPAYCAISLNLVSFLRETWKGDKLSIEAMDLVQPDLEKACNRNGHP